MLIQIKKIKLSWNTRQESDAVKVRSSSSSRYGSVLVTGVLADADISNTIINSGEEKTQTHTHTQKKLKKTDWSE